VRSGILVSCTLLCYYNLSHPQDEGIELGHAIGKVSTKGNLVIMEPDDGALGRANLLDVVGQTLRLTPDGSHYRVDTGTLNWESNFGSQLIGAEGTLHQFIFPFSGKKWDSCFVGTTGSIGFGTPEKDDSPTVLADPQTGEQAIEGRMR
jgi:hypothetical protein